MIIKVGNGMDSKAETRIVQNLLLKEINTLKMTMPCLLCINLRTQASNYSITYFLKVPKQLSEP